MYAQSNNVCLRKVWRITKNRRLCAPCLYHDKQKFCLACYLVGMANCFQINHISTVPCHKIGVFCLFICRITLPKFNRQRLNRFDQCVQYICFITGNLTLLYQISQKVIPSFFKNSLFPYCFLYVFISTYRPLNFVHAINEILSRRQAPQIAPSWKISFCSLRIYNYYQVSCVCGTHRFRKEYKEHSFPFALNLSSGTKWHRTVTSNADWGSYGLGKVVL